MKCIIFTSIFFLFIKVYSQDNQTVTLVVSGQAVTQNEATQIALRSAIEQAFGTFISSKTDIINDELITDEIVSISNGNIQHYEVISSVELPDKNHSVTLKATVSIKNLVSFVESKGFVSEFKGTLFAYNIMTQELYEKNELQAIENLNVQKDRILEKSFNYSLDVAEPRVLRSNWRNNENDDNKWEIPVTIDVSVNSNFFIFVELLEDVLKGLTLSSDQVNNYIKLNKPVFPVTLASNTGYGTYYLRSEKSLEKLIFLIYEIGYYTYNFHIANGIWLNELGSFNYYNKHSKVQINDNNFRILIKSGLDTDCGRFGASLFNTKRYLIEDFKFELVFFGLDEIKKREYEEFGYFLLFNSSGLSYNDFCGYNDNSSLKRFKILVGYDPQVKELGLGFTVSFNGIQEGTEILKFYYVEVLTLDEIKKITKYEILERDF